MLSGVSSQFEGRAKKNKKKQKEKEEKRKRKEEKRKRKEEERKEQQEVGMSQNVMDIFAKIYVCKENVRKTFIIYKKFAKIRENSTKILRMMSMITSRRLKKFRYYSLDFFSVYLVIFYIFKFFKEFVLIIFQSHLVLIVIHLLSRNQ